MRHAGRSHRRLAATPVGLEGLEARRVMAGLASTSIFVTQAYSQLIGDMKTLELNSRATPAEFLALRDDARGISAATATSTLPASSGQAEANAVSTLLDRSTVDGGLGPAGWADVQARLEGGLNALGIAPSLIDQTLADMQAIATSARVTPAQYQQFSRDFTSLSTSESIPGSINYGNTNPSAYFDQHLGGFFRGWAVQRTADTAKLKSDLQTIPADNGASGRGIAAVKRDANLLEKLGAKVPSQDNLTFLTTYATMIGPPTAGASDVSQQRASLVAALGVATSRSQEAQIQKLLSDAPAFDQAVGNSSANVQTITQDVQAVVNDGVAAAPNPFKVTFK